MTKITITLEYDDGSKKSHSATLPVMSKLKMNSLVDDAALQAGYEKLLPNGKENSELKSRYLCGWLFKVMANLVKSKRAEQASELARNKVLRSVSALQDATVIV